MILPFSCLIKFVILLLQRALVKSIAVYDAVGTSEQEVSSAPRIVSAVSNLKNMAAARPSNGNTQNLPSWDH